MKYLVIDTKKELEAVCKYFSTKEVLGVDTETTDFEPRRGRLRLIQISDGSKTILIDVFRLLENEGIFAKAIRTTRELMKAFGKAIRRIFKPLKDLFENPDIRIVIHNFKFEEKWLSTTCNISCNAVFDTFLAAQLIDYNDIKDPNRGHKLSVVMRRWTGVDLDKTEQASDWGEWDLTVEQHEYAALDVYYLPRLREVLLQELINQQLIRVAQIEFELAPVMAHVELNGVKVNRQLYEKEIDTIIKLRDKAENQLQDLVKTDDKPVQQSMFGLPEKDPNKVLLSSPAQMTKAFNEKGMPVYTKAQITLFEKYLKEEKYINSLGSYEKARVLKERYPKFDYKLYERYKADKKEGKQIIEGTGKKTLASVKGYDTVQALKEFRGVEIMVTQYGHSFLDLLEEEYEENERVYPNFYQIGAPTGRMSCNNPNVQKIPAKEVEVLGEKYKLGFRDAFDFPKGYVGINADYSQIELRVVAEMSADPIFMDAFISKKDLHADTASRIFNVPYEDCVNDKHDYYSRYRKPSKNINFGIVYGIGADALAGMINKTPEEAQDMIDKYYRAYPKLAEYLRKNKYFAINKLYAKTLSGRKQRFNEPSKNPDGSVNRREQGNIGRNGMNMPIQGCLAYDARIFVSGVGYRKIGEVSKEAHLVWDGNEMVKGFTTISGKKQLCQIGFTNGLTIDCSPEHKFYTYHKNTGYSWVEAKDLNKKSKILLGKEIPQFDYLNLNYEENIYLQRLNSRDLGILSAIIYLFGSSDENKAIRIPYDEYILNREFRRILRDGSIRFQESEIYCGHFKDKIQYILDSEFDEVIESFTVKNQFPEEFWASKPLIEAFLQILFNYSNIANESFVYRFDNKDKQLLKDIQQALLLFGINSTINNGLLSSRITITKNDARKFAVKIGVFDIENLLKGFTVSQLRNLNYKPNFVKVSEVTITDDFVEMYDVADSDTHQFMANGLVTHNTAADILKRSLKLLHDKIRENGYDARIVNIIHDEIMVEAHESCAEEVRLLVEKCMEDAGREFLTKVPIKVDAKIVTRWSDKA